MFKILAPLRYLLVIVFATSLLTNTTYAAFSVEAPGPAVIGAPGTCAPWSYVVDHTSVADKLFSITGDRDSVYIAGEINHQVFINTNSTAVIEKRDQKTGQLVTAFGNQGVLKYEPSLIMDRIHKIYYHDSYIYTLVEYNRGTYAVGIGFGSRYSSMMLEKRNSTTGVLEWSYDYPPNYAPGFPGQYSMVDLYVDDSGIYTALSSFVNVKDGMWIIEKRSLTNGGLVSGFGTNGIINNKLSYGSLQNIRGDMSSIYVAGTFLSSDGLNTKWKISKIDKLTGIVIWDKIYDRLDGLTHWMYFNGMAIDSSGIYLSGPIKLKDPLRSSWEDTRLLVEKRSLDDGNVIWSKEDSAQPTTMLGRGVSGIAVKGDSLYTVNTAYNIGPEYQNVTYSRTDANTGEVISLVTKNVHAYMQSVFAGESGVFAGGIIQRHLWTTWAEALEYERASKWYIESIDPSVCEEVEDIKYMDIGLRVNQGTPTLPNITHIAVEIEGKFSENVSSKLRIAKDNKIYRVALVDVDDPNATKIRVSVGGGVTKALRSCTATNGCLFVP